MNPNQTFNMHEINRLIMREQIPGFKMLPKERAYLDSYREALMKYHNYTERDKNEEAKKDQDDRNAKIEARKEAVKALKRNKKHANRHEQPIVEETTEPTTEEPIEPTVEETPTEEIVIE